jgi:2-methylcitrate dehydratase PrpD
VLEQKLFSFVKDFTITDVPVDVLNKAKLHVIDTIGQVFTGDDDPIVKRIDAAYRHLSSDYSGKKLAMGCAVRSSIYDFDDMNHNLYLHSGRIVIATALGMCCYANITGKEFLEAIIVGYDIHARIASGFVRKECGHRWNITTIAGTLASAIVAARLLKLDEEQTSHAFGIAFSMASGNMLCKKQEKDAYYFQQGNTWQQGISAAIMAGFGVTGPSGVLSDEKSGFYALFGKDVDRERVAAELGREYLLCKSSIKRYPCDASAQAAIDNVSSLIKRDKVGSRQIASINIKVTQSCYNKIGRRWTPEQSGREAKNIAQLLVAYQVGFQEIPLVIPEQNLAAAELLSLVSRVTVTPDEGLDARYEGQEISPCLVEITLSDGRKLSNAEQLAEAEVTPPELSWVKEKFLSCSAGKVSAERAHEILNFISRVDAEDDIADFVKTLRVQC